jgi:hypothetical protein
LAVPAIQCCQSSCHHHHHHHHHHQITKLSHSINAIGHTPHRGGRKREHRSIMFATITHIPSLHKIRRNAPRYHRVKPTEERQDTRAERRTRAVSTSSAVANTIVHAHAKPKGRTGALLREPIVQGELTHSHSPSTNCSHSLLQVRPTCLKFLVQSKSCYYLSRCYSEPPAMLCNMTCTTQANDLFTTHLADKMLTAAHNHCCSTPA